MASSALIRPVAPVSSASVLQSSYSKAGQPLKSSDRPFFSPAVNCGRVKAGAGRSNFLGTSLAVTDSSRKGSIKADKRSFPVEANVFKRAKRVVQSYTNAVKSSIDDPAKMLDDSLRELDKERKKVQETLKQVQFSISQLEGRGKQAALRAQDWHDRAKQALERGHEDLAREALRNQKEYEASVASLETQWKQQSALFTKLESSAGLLEEKIEEARAKRNALAARAQTASANRRVQEILGGISTGGAVAKFEEVKEKVSKLEAEAEALAEITGDNLEARFRNLERSNMDKELTQLRAEVGGSSKRDEVALKDRLALPDFLNLKRQSEERNVEVIDADELEARSGQPKLGQRALASSKSGGDVSKKAEEKPWWAGQESGRNRWGDYGEPSTSETDTWPSQGDWGDLGGRRREGDLTPVFPWQRVAALAMQLAFGLLVFGTGLGGRPGPSSYGPGLPGGIVLGGPFMGRSGVIVRRLSPFGGSPFDPLGQVRPYGGRMTRGGMVYRRIIID